MKNDQAVKPRAGFGAFLKAILAGAAMLSLPMGPAFAQMNTAPPIVRLDDDGTVHFPAMTVPVTEYLSPEGKAYLIQHLKDMQNPQMRTLNEEGIFRFLEGYVARQRELFPVRKEDTRIAGVHVEDYTPATIARENRRRVLINLHGGGFRECFKGCGELESRPLAALGGVRVVSVDYRQGPEHRHPAASEDVAAVYRELLKTYPARNIGIYGCSAGGMLTAMSVAWFQTHDLPRPGAIGVFCAGGTVPVLGTIGDSAHLVMAIGEANTALPTGSEPGRAPPGYLENVDVRDPLVAPALHDDVISRFPPTLIITGTRAMDLSSAAFLHRRLVQNNVEADLHVWEGMFHGFYTNPDVPESRQAYDVMVRFFDRRLGR